jgi:Ca2+-binding EF-hand superfamily protein
VYKLFRFYDRSNDGLISAREFISLMRRDAKIAPAQMSDAALRRIFARDVDQDGTGQVDFEEFVRWLASDEGEAAQQLALTGNSIKLKSGSSSAALRATSSGYGRVSSTMYSSPGQRRFSQAQGWVVPSTDGRRVDLVANLKERSAGGGGHGAEKKDSMVTFAAGVPLVVPTLTHRLVASTNAARSQPPPPNMTPPPLPPPLPPPPSPDVVSPPSSASTPRRSQRRRMSTRENIKSPVKRVRSKLRSAAYDKGGVNFDKLFKFYALKEHCVLDAQEFVRVMRKDAKLSRKEVSDQVLVKMFKQDIDAEKKGEISIAEFVRWAKEVEGSSDNDSFLNNKNNTPDDAVVNIEDAPRQQPLQQRQFRLQQDDTAAAEASIAASPTGWSMEGRGGGGGVESFSGLAGELSDLMAQLKAL